MRSNESGKEFERYESRNPGAKGFEQVELTEPKKALEQAGAKTEIVSLVTSRKPQDIPPSMTR